MWCSCRNPGLSDPQILKHRHNEDIAAACESCGGSIAAFVIMPDHLHLLVALPEKDSLHKFCKLWRGRSGRHIPRVLEKQGDHKALEVLAKHANGGCHYATWKEQVRALAVWSRPKLYSVVNYIHANPVRRGLVEHPKDWLYSSYRFYEHQEPVGLDVVPINP
ncbi:MAG: transposase [Armatimonadota bacterium]